MSPFNPIGTQARWRTVYDIIQQRPTDSVITYDELGEVLNLDPDKDRHAIQMAMRRAAKESEEQDDRALDSVPNTGYRIVRPPEHMRLAKDQQKRSRSALVRGQSKVVHVDFNDMEPEIRKSFEVVAQAIRMQLEMMRRLDIRQKRVEQSVQEIQQQSQRSAEDIAALQERLERLEQINPGVGPDTNPATQT